jgi:hypothetical protein
MSSLFSLELPSLSESEFTQEEGITARREIEHLSEVEELFRIFPLSYMCCFAF